MTEREPLSTEPYKGVRDFYPEELSVREAVFGKIREALKLRGFEEYDASPLERTELYERKTSEEIVHEQTYTFTDRGGRSVTLRPEMTPTLARMIAAKRRELVYPVRWFNIGNRFRYERTQKGRLREFYQVDVDIIGIPNERAEGEVVVIAYDLLKLFGAKDADFTIRVNSRVLLNAACEGLSEEERKSYLSLLDRKEKMDAETFEKERSVYRRKGKDPLEMIEGGGNPAVDAEKERVLNLLVAFSARGMTNVVFDSTVVRGFLYYTGLVFEIFDTNPENPRALFGGGRYDGLISLFGGEPIPAIGFAFGDVTLMEFLSSRNLLPKARPGATVYLGTPSPEDVGSAQTFAETLRKEGISVLVNVTERSLGDQIKEAVKRGISYFIAYGAEEKKKGKVLLKQLSVSKEKTVKEKDIAKEVMRG